MNKIDNTNLGKALDDYLHQLISKDARTGRTTKMLASVAKESVVVASTKQQADFFQHLLRNAGFKPVLPSRPGYCGLDHDEGPLIMIKAEIGNLLAVNRGRHVVFDHTAVEDMYRQAILRVQREFEELDRRFKQPEAHLVSTASVEEYIKQP